MLTFKNSYWHKKQFLNNLQDKSPSKYTVMIPEQAYTVVSLSGLTPQIDAR